MNQLYYKPSILPDIGLSDHQAVQWSWKAQEKQEVYNAPDATSKTAAFYNMDCCV